MITRNSSTNRPNMNGTKTVEDYVKFLGEKPHRLGIMARQNPELTTSFLTEGMRNVTEVRVGNPKQISSFMVEWDVDQTYIKRIAFTAAPEGNGVFGSPISMTFEEPFFGKYDTFRVEGSRQQFIVVSNPTRKSDKAFKYAVQIVGSNPDELVNTIHCQPGRKVRWISNAHPELSEEGNVKAQSNMETHRNYITRHRNDVVYSSDFEVLEDTFISIAKGDKENSGLVFKMNTKEKELMDTHAEAKNQANLFSKCNVDKHGKCHNFDPATNRPIVIGDGVIPQIERLAEKIAYAKMTVNTFEKMIHIMRQKSKKPQGNTYVLAMNTLLHTETSVTLRDYLKDWKTDGATFFQKEKGKIKVGGDFESYSFGGNTVVFIIDKALDLEYDQRPYGICVDLTGDLEKGKPAMESFTLKGMAMKRHVINGVGSKATEISTAVAGQRSILMSYSGIAVYAPGKSVILQKNQA